jgi:hypothetical protein
MADKKLNPQQLDFLARYMRPDSPTYGNATNSAVAAGYSEIYAKSIMTQAPWFSDLRGKDSKLWSGEEILERLQGEASGEHAKDRIKSLELLGKAQKLFIDRTDHTTNGKELPAPIFGGQSNVPSDNSNQ